MPEENGMNEGDDGKRAAKLLENHISIECTMIFLTVNCLVVTT